MQFYSTSRAGKRVRTLIFTVAIVLILYILFQRRGPAHAPPPLPLPKTYQYFFEKDFYSKTKLFGAVSHCDARFAPRESPEVDEVRRSLNALLRSYVATMDNLHVETWIVHGALLGWYWNQKLLPWDTDLDVQVSAVSIAFLAKFHDMTEYSYTLSEVQGRRTYLLDINPHYSIVSNEDVANKIDARWIDTTSGKFIDITAVHRKETVNGGEKSTMLFCKDGHQYKEGDIYPLQPSFLEGIKVNVPPGYENILREEYGKKALTNGRFHWHHFNHNSKIWEPE